MVRRVYVFINRRVLDGADSRTGGGSLQLLLFWAFMGAMAGFGDGCHEQ